MTATTSDVTATMDIMTFDDTSSLSVQDIANKFNNTTKKKTKEMTLTTGLCDDDKSHGGGDDNDGSRETTVIMEGDDDDNDNDDSQKDVSLDIHDETTSLMTFQNKSSSSSSSSSKHIIPTVEDDIKKSRYLMDPMWWKTLGSQITDIIPTETMINHGTAFCNSIQEQALSIQKDMRAWWKETAEKSTVHMNPGMMMIGLVVIMNFILFPMIGIVSYSTSANTAMMASHNYSMAMERIELLERTVHSLRLEHIEMKTRNTFLQFNVSQTQLFLNTLMDELGSQQNHIGRTVTVMKQLQGRSYIEAQSMKNSMTELKSELEGLERTVKDVETKVKTEWNRTTDHMMTNIKDIETKFKTQLDRTDQVMTNIIFEKALNDMEMTIKTKTERTDQLVTNLMWLALFLFGLWISSSCGSKHGRSQLSNDIMNSVRLLVILVAFGTMVHHLPATESISGTNFHPVNSTNLVDWNGCGLTSTISKAGSDRPLGHTTKFEMEEILEVEKI